MFSSTSGETKTRLRLGPTAEQPLPWNGSSFRVHTLTRSEPLHLPLVKTRKGPTSRLWKAEPSGLESLEILTMKQTQVQSSGCSSAVFRLWPSPKVQELFFFPYSDRRCLSLPDCAPTDMRRSPLLCIAVIFCEALLFLMRESLPNCQGHAQMGLLILKCDMLQKKKRRRRRIGWLHTFHTSKFSINDLYLHQTKKKKKRQNKIKLLTAAC